MEERDILFPNAVEGSLSQNLTYPLLAPAGQARIVLLLLYLTILIQDRHGFQPAQNIALYLYRLNQNGQTSAITMISHQFQTRAAGHHIPGHLRTWSVHIMNGWLWMKILIFTGRILKYIDKDVHMNGNVGEYLCYITLLMLIILYDASC